MSETVPSNYPPVDQDSLQTVMKIPNDLDTPDFKSEFITRHPEIGLGREAILRSLHDTEEIIDNDDKNRFTRKFTSMFDKKSSRQKAKEIQAIRESLNALSPEYAREIFDQMDDTFIKTAIFTHGVPSEVSWMGNPLGERFVASKKDKKEYAVSDETVLNFAQWYMGLTLDKQKQYDAEIGGLREQYKNRIRSAVEKGWTPERVISNLRNIDNSDVIQDDMFATIADGSLGWYDAYSSMNGDGRSTIVISPIENEQSSKDEIRTHEWTHAFVNDPEEKYNRTRLLRELFGEGGSFIINEALTEHFAQSLIHGDFDTINPELRTPKGSYTQFRTLLDKICNGGLIEIDIREFYEALYFTSQDNKELFMKGESVRNLFKKINESFPDMSIVLKLAGIRNDDDFDNLLDDLNNFTGKEDAEEKQPEYTSL